MTMFAVFSPPPPPSGQEVKSRSKDAAFNIASVTTKEAATAKVGRMLQILSLCVCADSLTQLEGKQAKVAWREQSYVKQNIFSRISMLM